MFEDKIRGTYAVTTTPEGKYSATLEKGFGEALESLKENSLNSKFRILSTKNGLYAVNSENSVKLLKEDDNNQVIEPSSSELRKINRAIIEKKSISDIEKTSIICEDSTKENVNNNFIFNVISNPINKYLDVSIVRQSGNTCWAATCAAIINYETRSSTRTSLSDIDVAKYVYGDDWNKGGLVKEELKAYNHWGLYRTYYSSSISYSKAVEQLQSGSPIDCGFYAYRNVLMNYGHAMTCRGFVEYENGSKYFSLIDPNSSSYVSVTAYDNTNDVTYILNGRTYYWCESLLNF